VPQFASLKQGGAEKKKKEGRLQGSRKGGATKNKWKEVDTVALREGITARSSALCITKVLSLKQNM